VIAELRVFRDPEEDHPGVHRVIFEPRLSIARERLEAFATASSQRLSELFGKEIRTRTSEPRHGAMDFDPNVIRGSIAFAVEAMERSAILLLSEEHARRLAAYAFSEKSPAPKVGLSVIEERLVERIIRELATLCTPFTGSQESVNVATIDDVTACTTHFILRIGSPMDVAILVGLTAEESPPQGAPLDPHTLHDVTVTANVEFASAILKAAQIAALRIGSVIEFSTSLDDPAFLRIDQTTIASGACGMCDGRPAFFVQQQYLPALR
jgi:flagellar motor switch/type III secretory pathway protein FliN